MTKSIIRKISILATMLIVAALDTTAAEIDSLIHNVAIEFNGADWSGIRQRLSDYRREPVVIVHIGDSHLQADWPTSHLRREMQARYGDAGRGLITPLKMSGTYQPADYTITSPDKWTAAKFLKYPWTPRMSFAGTALTPPRSDGELTITLNATGKGKSQFDDIEVHHDGSFRVTEITDRDGNEIAFTTDVEPGEWTLLRLERHVDKATVKFADASEDFVLQAINLTNGNAGLLYHTIGNGGADMHQYNLIKRLGEGVARLYPDLIILALGTNDSYNHFSRERFSTNLDKIVDDLRRHNPDAAILLVTPMEIQMSKTTTVRTGKGKKARRRTKKVRSRHVVEGCSTIHEMMLDYAREHHLAIYDWYEATGGAGASQPWVDAGLMREDHIHLTSAGYKKHAEMLYEALIEALEGQTKE